MKEELKPLFTEEAEKDFWHRVDNNMGFPKDDYVFIDGTFHLKEELT